MRLLYVVTEDWYFLSHRLPMARAARDAGFEVHVATRVVDGGAAIKAEGFALHPVPFARGRLSPPGTLATIRAAPEHAWTARSSLLSVHHVALQAAVLGSLAALGPAEVTRRQRVDRAEGYTFTHRAAPRHATASSAAALLRAGCSRLAGDGQVVLVQNPDDRANMLALGIAKAERIVLIPGSGVYVNALKPMAEPAGPVTVAFVGRLLADKGIHTLIEAQRLLRQRRVPCRTAARPARRTWPIPRRRARLTWPAGPGCPVSPCSGARRADISWTVAARRTSPVLPVAARGSLPKSLLEAAACHGRPMVATDVPRCREIVRARAKPGLLVPVDDAAALAAAIETLASPPELRARHMARRPARRFAVERFSADAIGRQTVDLYRRLVG